MGKIGIGVNMEFVRHADKSFEWGVEKAAELGYEYVEPMVHWGRELLSEAGYFHSVSMLDDPYRIKRACEKAGIKLSGPLGPHAAVQAGDRHGVPQAGDSLRRRVRGAGGQHRRRHEARLDHGGRGFHADPLHAQGGRRRGRAAGHPDRHRAAPASTARRRTAWTASRSSSTRRRSASTSTPATATSPARTRSSGSSTSGPGWSTCTPRTSPSSNRTPSGAKSPAPPVGCACGDGVIDWKKVVEICKTLPRDIVFSVECGTIEQAERSIQHLRQFV